MGATVRYRAKNIEMGHCAICWLLPVLFVTLVTGYRILSGIALAHHQNDYRTQLLHSYSNRVYKVALAMPGRATSAVVAKVALLVN